MIKIPLWKTASPGGASQHLDACPLPPSSRHRSGPGRCSRWLLLPCLLVLFLTLSASAASADILRVLVMFRDGTPTWVQQKLIAQSRARVVTWFPVVNTVVLELPAGPLLGTTTSATSTLGVESLPPSAVSTTETAFSFLSKHLGLAIEALEVDFYISLHDRPGALVAPLEPSPLKGGYRWNLRQIALDEVGRQVQGQGVHVAVLDTGIDPAHQLLAGRVGNSYNARIYEDDKTDYVDRNGHGTHVAGIIAAAAGRRHASQVLRGIAPGVTLHAVRVLDETGGGYLTDLISGLVWVYQQPYISVVNMSLGSTNGSRVVEKIIHKLYDADVVLVASAGNCTATATSGTDGDGEGGDGEGGDSGTDSQGCQQQEVKYPAVYWRTIAVGATDVDTQVTYYSVTGPHVDVVAPGGTRQTGQVVSTNTTVSAGTASATTSGADGNSLAANGEGGDGEGGDGEGGDGEGGDGEGGDSEGGDGEGGDGTTEGGAGLYALGRGTSQAAPHVTGVVALMRGVNPQLTPAQVRTILQETAVDLGAPASAQGAGLIDAARAVKRAQSLR